MAALSPSTTPDIVSDLPPACLLVRQTLDAYVDGEVSELEAVSVLAHVNECDACRRAEAALRRFLSAVRHSQLPVLASRRLRLRIAQMLAAQDSSAD